MRTTQAPASEWPGGLWLSLELTSPAIIYPRYVFNSELSIYRAAYPRPADTRAHERAFGTAALTFDAPLTQVAFGSPTLAQPVLYAHPGLFPLFEQHAAAMLAQLPGQPPLPLVEQVRAEILRQLKGEVPTQAAIAERLHLGVRALQLKLKAAGHTYQQLLDAVLCDLAQRHLREAHLSTTEASVKSLVQKLSEVLLNLVVARQNPAFSA